MVLWDSGGFNWWGNREEWAWWCGTDAGFFISDSQFYPVSWISVEECLWPCHVLALDADDWCKMLEKQWN